MKVLLTGAAGQLGRELQRTVPANIALVGVSHSESPSADAVLDITDAPAVAECFQHHHPDIVINAAAYTLVDVAEAEPEAAYAVNSGGAANLAENAARHGARLVHVSTDFVFDGTSSIPYRPEDPTAPLGVYGASKLEGEQRVVEISAGRALIIRSAWIYSSSGSNFVCTMLRLLRERDELKVVADQVGTPTWARSLARAIWSAVPHSQLHGIYHWTDEGVASWYDFAVAIQEEALSLGLLQKQVPIMPISTSEYPTPARRPGYSVLDKTSAWKDFGMISEPWRNNLRAMLAEMKK